MSTSPTSKRQAAIDIIDAWKQVGYLVDDTAESDEEYQRLYAEQVKPAIEFLEEV